MDSHLDPAIEAAALCAFIKERVAEYESLQIQLEKCVAAPQPGPSGTPRMRPKAVDHEVVVHEVPEVLDLATTDIPIPDDVRYPSEFGLDDLDDNWSADEAVGESFLASNSVDKMLSCSVKPATARKYSRIWDKWVAFAASYGVEIMPPDIRALEIFVADSAEHSGSSGVALTAVAAVAHFSALQGFGSPCEFPRFGKLLRGICLTHGKAAKPKNPFTPAHIISFMNLARSGTLREWRAALPLACASSNYFEERNVST
jgi:hypothetical protein